MISIPGMTLIEVRDAIASGELTSEEVTQTAINYAQRFDKDYGLFITLMAESALEQAKAADLARSMGVNLGPLHGVPITVKDNIDTAGIPSTAGAAIFRERIPAYDATVVANLRQAGAIMLGKNNLHEMALGATSTNPHYGAVRNPWAKDCIPGGSSGGSAAAQSLQIGYASLGTDSGGSVRIPASLCGLVGLKQTHGVVSLSGCIPTGIWSTDHIGPITKTVTDAALMLSCMQSYDPTDPDSTPRMPDFYPPLETLAGLKVGIPEQYFWEELDPEVEQICRNTVALMQEAGAEVVPISLESVDLLDVARIAALAEAYVFHEPYLQSHEQDYGEDIRYRLLTGRYVLASDYIRSTRARRVFMEEFNQSLKTVDVMVTPTVPVPAPAIGAETVTIGDRKVLLSNPGITLLARNTFPANQAGTPAISLPAGLTESGLPVGFQLMAAAFQDYKLLAIAAVMENLLHFDPTPPILNAVEVMQ
ncbi:MAG: amidase [Elainellaceae cyanobacterium]